MDFERFRRLKGWSLDDAAAALRATGDPSVARINGSAIAKHERGLRWPRPAVISAYAAITEGAVGFDDWNRTRLAGHCEPRQRGRWKKPVLEAA
jgi:hypothetical protein